MPNSKHQISDVKIKQVFLLAVILVLVGLIVYNLSLFIPSVLGAITLYIITRRYNLFLQEEREWKPWASATLIIVATLLILILPVYFIADMLIEKMGNASAYMEKFNIFVDKIHDYVYAKTRMDLLSKENLGKLKDSVGKYAKAWTSAESIAYFNFLKSRMKVQYQVEKHVSGNF